MTFEKIKYNLIINLKNIKIYNRIFCRNQCSNIKNCY